MSHEVTMYRDGEVTRVQFRWSKGCLTARTSMSVDEVAEVIKGIDRPTSRQRAVARCKALRAAKR